MSKMMMNLSDGFREELKDLYSAEQQLLKALPKMEKKATDPKLKQALMAHLAETEGQIERLDEIAGILEEKLSSQARFVIFAYLVNNVWARKASTKDLRFGHSQFCHKVNYGMGKRVGFLVLGLQILL